jgi:hypothetical protein
MHPDEAQHRMLNTPKGQENGSSVLTTSNFTYIAAGKLTFSAL